MANSDLERLELRRRIAQLKEEARRNEETWRRSQHREMQLLEAETLLVLFERLVGGMRESYRLKTVTLALSDPQHEVRHLLLSQGQQPEALAGVAFVDSVAALAPQLLPQMRPWLGPFEPERHGPLFPDRSAPSSIALLPLVRQRKLVGSLNLGSSEPGRFTAAHGSDFLRHLAVIAGFCLENTVNRARLVRSGFTDFLTGWHNRRYLQVRLREGLASCQRERTTMICLMIDIDHFKRINDRWGHPAGDDVLREVARRIAGEVRSSDVAARYGGEEFLLLLPNTNGEAGRRLAERIRLAVADQPFTVGDGLALEITVSIGIAGYRPAAGREEDLETAGKRLLAQADAALYEAKTGGRNTIAQAINV